MFSVTQHGKELDKSKYVWDENNKVFSTKEDNLVLDFSDYSEVIFKTGSSCTFKTGSSCTFKTGDNCTFNTGENCFVTRYDVKGVIEIPEKKTIKLNGYGISGYTEIKEEIKEEIKKTNCEGKVVEIVEIEGKKYKLVSV